jgi:hypothetical protein
MGAGLVMLLVGAFMWGLLWYLGRDYGLPWSEKVLRQQLRDIRRRKLWNVLTGQKGDT